MKRNAKSQRVLSDQELLKTIDGLVREEKHLEAARLLRKIEDPSAMSVMHRKLLSKVGIIEYVINFSSCTEKLNIFTLVCLLSLSPLFSTSYFRQAVDELLSSPQEGWTKQGESHGQHDFTIYYKVQDGARLTCRIESPIPHCLLVPLLSLLNESGLYQTWIPSWQTPFKVGVQKSKQLLNDSRGHQVIQVSVSVPWPMKPREALFSVQAVDEIDSNGLIIAKMTSIGDTGEGEVIKKSLPGNFEVPELTEGMERCDFGGITIFRHCPTDHPNYKMAQSKFPNKDLILTQFMMSFDAKMTMVPKSMINFITRTALGTVWNMLLRVAEQVREGNREEHCNMIAQKAGFYNWVEERCSYMLRETKNSNQNDTEREHNRGNGKHNIQEYNHLSNEHGKEKGNGAWTLQEILRMNM